MSIYTTAQDAIEAQIVTAIEATGDATADQYDIRAIFDATFEYSNELGGFVQIADETEFWQAVQAAAL